MRAVYQTPYKIVHLSLSTIFYGMFLQDTWIVRNYCITLNPLMTEYDNKYLNKSSANDLSPVRPQAISWTNTNFLLIEHIEKKMLSSI